MEKRRVLKSCCRSGATLTSNKGCAFVLRQVSPDLHNGFTLIELLVVVLIIGILAAVAVPQYQKAVWKSRFAQAKILATSLAQAEEAYYMATGSYTRNYDELGIDIPPTTGEIQCFSSQGCYANYRWGNCCINEDNVKCRLVKAGHNNNGYLAYVVGLSHANEPGTRCLAWGKTGKPTASDINYQICRAETNATPRGYGGGVYSWQYK